MKEIRYILVLVIGGVLFWVGIGLVASYMVTPRSNWIDVIPTIHGTKSVNLTTNTFIVTGEKWKVSWWPSEANPNDKCVVEVYNASTDEKLQEFTLSTNWPEVSAGSGDLKITGSFYLKIQVYKEDKYGEAWWIRVREYKLPLEFPIWVAGIIVIGIASSAVFFGYKKLRHI